jgi:hypothetical protein
MSEQSNSEGDFESTRGAGHDQCRNKVQRLWIAVEGEEKEQLANSNWQLA